MAPETETASEAPVMLAAPAEVMEMVAVAVDEVGMLAVERDRLLESEVMSASAWSLRAPAAAARPEAAVPDLRICAGRHAGRPRIRSQTSWFEGAD